MADSTQNYYRVGSDGKAPPGLNVGDQVVTGGGTYRIVAVNADGSYESELVNKNLTTANYGGEYATPGARENPAEDMKSMLGAWSDAALRQQQAKIDYETAERVSDLNAAQAQAEQEFQSERDRNEIDAARAMDNAAHYAEARGDRGGIGLAQYNEVQAAALQNRRAINLAQTNAAAETAREIAALRAKGEFQKADALLDVTQKYLKELMSLEKWSANWETAQTQLRRSLEQWERSYALSRAGVTGELPDGSATRAATAQLAASGEALLKGGVMPSAEQLAAMGITAQQARDYIAALLAKNP